LPVQVEVHAATGAASGRLDIDVVRRVRCQFPVIAATGPDRERKIDRAAVRGAAPSKRRRRRGEVARVSRQYRDARRRLGGILRARDIARGIVGAGREAYHHGVPCREAARIRPCWIGPVHVDYGGAVEAGTADGAATTGTGAATTTAPGTDGDVHAQLIACQVAV